MGPIYSLADVMDMLRRHVLLIAGVTMFGAVASVFLALLQSHEYETTEVIQIERPMIDDTFLATGVDASSGRRLQAVEQQLMTRGTMLEIIDKYRLFSDRPGWTAIERAQALREAITIDGIAAAREGIADDGAIAIISITTRMPTPEQAQVLARELSARSIELYAARRIGEAQTTLDFFVEQEKQIVERLQNLDTEVADYRTSQELGLPLSVEFSRSQMAALSSAILDIEREKIAVQRELDRLDSTTRRAATLEREVTALQTQLDSLDDQRMLLVQRLETLAASIETSPEVQRQLGAFERERQQLRDQLEVVATRRAEAEVGLILETERKSERLTVLDPAVVPDYPATPSRKRMVFMGAFGSAALGVLLAFVMDLRTPVIRTPQQMEREAGLAPVISLPNVQPLREKPDLKQRILLWFQGKVPVQVSREDPRDVRRSS